MKVFINNRNLFTWPSKMAEVLIDQGHEVTFIDNGSTYPRLLEYYEGFRSINFKVIRLPNIGNRAAWTANIVTELNEPYVVTDPDYDLSMLPDDWAEVLCEGLKEFPTKNKFGLTFDESQVPPENPAYFMDQFDKYPNGVPYIWDRKLPNNWLEYPCDTSFAVQRPHTPAEIGGVRKGRPYTVIHWPWHVTLEPTKTPGKISIPFDEEVYYYFKHCENSSCTMGRMIESGMLREYERRHNIAISYAFNWRWI